MTDPIIAAARFLTAQLSWLRHATDQQGQPVAADVFREIGDCAARMRGLVEGPREQRFLGPCAATLCTLCGQVGDGHVCEGDIPVWTCEGDVYGVAGAQTGRCRTCGATVDQAERRQWLDDEVRERAFTAKDIADAYGINVKTIRSWAAERQARWDHSGTLVQPARQAKLREHGHDRDGRSLFLIGDVLDLAAADAARREERRVERERRAARRGAEMGA